MISKTKADLLIIIITLIYSSSFLVMKILADTGMSAAFIVFSRGLLYLLFALIFFGKSIKTITKKEFLIGLVAGLLNFGGYFFQTMGIAFTTPSNNAFLTGTNALFVPIVAFLFYKIKPSKKLAISLPLGLIGVAILSNFDINKLYLYNIGDLYSLICAVLFGSLITYLGYTAVKIDFKKTSFVMALCQMVGGALLLPFTGIGTINAGSSLIMMVMSLLYLGMMCSFLATSIQIYAQKYTTAVTTVLILSLEGVFAGVFSVLFGIELFSINLLIGGLMIVAAVITIETDFKKFLKRKGVKKPL